STPTSSPPISSVKAPSPSSKPGTIRSAPSRRKTFCSKLPGEMCIDQVNSGGTRIGEVRRKYPIPLDYTLTVQRRNRNNDDDRTIASNNQSAPRAASLESAAGASCQDTESASPPPLR